MSAFLLSTLSKVVATKWHFFTIGHVGCLCSKQTYVCLHRRILRNQGTLEHSRLMLCSQKLSAEGSFRASLPLSNLWHLIHFPLATIYEDDANNMAKTLEKCQGRADQKHVKMHTLKLTLKTRVSCRYRNSYSLNTHLPSQLVQMYHCYRL